MSQTTLQATTCTALNDKESVGIFPMLNYRPIANVLLPSVPEDGSRHLIQTFMGIPMNLNRLLKGIFMCQENPWRV
jgi:hypothetical protein